jgi:hypothetical protein
MDGARCDALLGQIADMGWDPEEANYGNIVVEARPNSDELHLHNHRACEGSEFLAPLDANKLVYGTLSHSHLHQFLKNLRAGAPAKAPTAFIVNGRLSIEAVERVQPELARSARTGLAWTILSHKIRDDPYAMQIIQAAANRRASVAMRETSMQAVSRLANICDRACGADGKVNYNEAKKLLAHTMPDVCDSGEFLGLLRFVVNLGAGKAPFIPYLKEFFGFRGQNRQVRPATFALAGSLGSKVPHVSCGLVVMALTAPPPFFVDGVSRFLVAADVRALQDKDTNEPIEKAVQAEAILRWFHRAGEESKGKPGVQEQTRLDLLGKTDSVLCRWLTGKHLGAYEGYGETIDLLAEKVSSEFAAAMPKGFKIDMKKPWTVPEKVHRARENRSGSSSSRLDPAIIRFEDGKALNAQEERREQVTTEDIDWHSSVSIPMEDIAKGTLFKFLHDASAALGPIARASVGLRRDSTGETRVIALEDIPEGGVALVPTVAAPGGIVVERPTATYPVNSLKVLWMDVKLVILPSYKLPPKGTQVVDWDKKAFCPPYWMVTRTALAGLGNCCLAEIVWNGRDTLKFGEAPLVLSKKIAACAAVGRVPVMTAAKNIKQGEEFVFQVAPTQSGKRSLTVSTWESSKQLKQQG